MFGKKKEPQPAPQVEYTYEIYPDNVPDGQHIFDDKPVTFRRPGWQWLITEHVEGKWPTYKVGSGYSTRDEALVSLLETLKELDQNGRQSDQEGDK